MESCKHAPVNSRSPCRLVLLPLVRPYMLVSFQRALPDQGSGIDRVYSSLHTAHGYMDEVSCNTLDRHPHLSAHRPISLQLRKFDAQPNPFKRVLELVNQHERFGEEVFAEYHDCVRKNCDDPFTHLQVFKEAVQRATRYIQRIANKQEARTTDDKIAVSTSFLRALYKSDWKRAGALQSISEINFVYPMPCL